MTSDITTHLLNQAAPTDGGLPTATQPDTPIARPLSDFLPGGPAGGHQAVLVFGWVEAVVLRQASNLQIEVWQNDQITCWAPDTEATAISDPARRNALLQAAVLGLAGLLQAIGGKSSQDATVHRLILAKIRNYAIDRYQKGTICRNGLNEFLRAFGLKEYEPRILVRYVLYGSYEIDSYDTDAAIRDASNHLNADLSALDNVIDDSDDVMVQVQSVEEFDY